MVLAIFSNPIIQFMWYTTSFFEEQGWRSGESICLPPMERLGPGIDSHAKRGLSLLVLYSAPKGFSSGTPVFPSPQKPLFDLICSDFS